MQLKRSKYVDDKDKIEKSEKFYSITRQYFNLIFRYYFIYIKRTITQHQKLLNTILELKNSLWTKPISNRNEM